MNWFKKATKAIKDIFTLQKMLEDKRYKSRSLKELSLAVDRDQPDTEKLLSWTFAKKVKMRGGHAGYSYAKTSK